MEKKFPNLTTETSTSKIIELSAENLSPMKIDSPTATIPKRYVDNNDYVVSSGNNDRYESDSWTCNNQLYVLFLFQVDN